MSTLLLLLALSQYTPQEAQALFVEANDAYYKADYQAAKAKYEKLLEAGLGGPDVLFNLGTTHLASGELGPAMLYLERAHRLAPDDDVEANLALARQKQVDQVVGEDAAVPFTQRLADAVDEPLISAAFLGTWWLAFVVFWLWRRQRGSRVLLGLGGVVVLAGALALGAVVGVNAWVRRSVIEAVVMPATSKVLEFPGPNAKTAFEVHAGLKVRVMEESGRFVRIRLPNALEGWTPKDAVVEL
jgi:hypothetical protein